MIEPFEQNGAGVQNELRPSIARKFDINQVERAVALTPEASERTGARDLAPLLGVGERNLLKLEDGQSRDQQLLNCLLQFALVSFRQCYYHLPMFGIDTQGLGLAQARLTAKASPAAPLYGMGLN
jgi:hypothetical protein